MLANACLVKMEAMATFLGDNVKYMIYDENLCDRFINNPGEKMIEKKYNCISKYVSRIRL